MLSVVPFYDTAMSGESVEVGKKTFVDGCCGCFDIIRLVKKARRGIAGQEIEVWNIVFLQVVCKRLERLTLGACRKLACGEALDQEC